MRTDWSRKRILALSAGISIIIAGLLYGAIRYRELLAEKIALEGDVAARERDIDGLEEVLGSLRADLGRSQEESRNLAQSLDAERQALGAERNKNSAFEAQIREISGTVSALQKLSETDPELLKK